MLGTHTAQLKIALQQALPPDRFDFLSAGTAEEAVSLIAGLQQINLLALSSPLAEAASILKHLRHHGCRTPAILLPEKTISRLPIKLLRLNVLDCLPYTSTSGQIRQAVYRILKSTSFASAGRFHPNLAENTADETTLLSKIGRLIDTLDLEVVLNRITEAAVFLTGAEEGYLLLPHTETNQLFLRSTQSLGEKQAKNVNQLITDPIAAGVAKTGKAIYLYEPDARKIKIKTGYLFKSLINVPVKHNKQVVGVIGVGNQISDVPFTPEQRRRMAQLAELVATPLENAGRYHTLTEQLNRSLREAETHQMITAQQAVMAANFEMSAQLALSLALKTVQANAGLIIWKENPPDPFQYITQGTIPPPGRNHSRPATKSIAPWWDETVLQTVIATGSPLLTPQVTREDSIVSGQPDHSRLIVPLKLDSRSIGAIEVDRLGFGALTEDDLQFMIAFSRQIAEGLKNALQQKKSRAEQVYLTTIIEAINNGVWFFDPDLRLVFQNQAAGEMSGWTLAEVQGHPITDLLPAAGNTPHRLCQLLQQVIAEQQPLSFRRNIFLPINSGPASTAISGRIIPFSPEGKLSGVLCVFWKDAFDLGLKHLELDFTNMASHLLRNPLNFIQSSINLLLDDTVGVTERRETLGKMRQQATQLIEFTNELLKMLRLEAEGAKINARPLNLPPLIEQVMMLVNYNDPRHVFNLDVTMAMPAIIADQTKVELVLLNLLLNAVKRCPEGGHITVKSEVYATEVAIFIIDDGKAIPPSILERIFEQFYPVGAQEGKMPTTYQLGLYTVRRLIELQGGRVWAKNAPGQGAVFGFSLPTGA